MQRIYGLGFTEDYVVSKVLDWLLLGVLLCFEKVPYIAWLPFLQFLLYVQTFMNSIDYNRLYYDSKNRSKSTKNKSSATDKNYNKEVKLFGYDAYVQAALDETQMVTVPKIEAVKEIVLASLEETCLIQVEDSRYFNEYIVCTYKDDKKASMWRKHISTFKQKSCPQQR